jgi:ABC-2 type transport system ATP-binding protein
VTGPTAPPPSTTTPPDARIALRTRGLKKRYGARPALQGLDLVVPAGVVYGLLGPNGAGKTTLMRLLVGLIRPDAGEIEILGQPYTWRQRQRLFRVGALVESPTFYGYLSGRDNLRALAATGGPVGPGRIDAVLDLVGLHERSRDKVGTYSMGMKQRLGIAGAMLSDPELLLLDEPANGLDPGGIVAMRHTLRGLTEAGKTVFISSHILPEVQQLVDVVGIVDHGKLIREGSIAELLAEGAHVRVQVPDAERAAAVTRLEGLGAPIEASPADASGLASIAVRVAPERAAEVNRFLAEGGIYAAGIGSGNDLEAVFLSLTEGAPRDDVDDDTTQAGPPIGWGERT